jgi:hypothetical protein
MLGSEETAAWLVREIEEVSVALPEEERKIG